MKWMLILLCFLMFGCGRPKLAPPAHNRVIISDVAEPINMTPTASPGGYLVAKAAPMQSSKDEIIRQQAALLALYEAEIKELEDMIKFLEAQL